MGGVGGGWGACVWEWDVVGWGGEGSGTGGGRGGGGEGGRVGGKEDGEFDYQHLFHTTMENQIFPF